MFFSISVLFYFSSQGLFPWRVTDKTERLGDRRLDFFFKIKNSLENCNISFILSQVFFLFYLKNFPQQINVGESFFLRININYSVRPKEIGRNLRR